MIPRLGLTRTSRQPFRHEDNNLHYQASDGRGALAVPSAPRTHRDIRSLSASQKMYQFPARISGFQDPWFRATWVSSWTGADETPNDPACSVVRTQVLSQNIGSPSLLGSSCQLGGPVIGHWLAAALRTLCDQTRRIVVHLVPHDIVGCSG